MAELTEQQKAELQKELEAHKDDSETEKQKRVQSYVRRTLDHTISKDKAHALANRVLNEATKFHQQFKERTSTAIIAAFGFLIALSWQDLIKNIINTYTPTDLFVQYPYLAQLISALLITLIAVLAIMIVSRWAQKTE